MHFPKLSLQSRGLGSAGRGTGVLMARQREIVKNYPDIRSKLFLDSVDGLGERSTWGTLVIAELFHSYASLSIPPDMLRRGIIRFGGELVRDREERRTFCPIQYHATGYCSYADHNYNHDWKVTSHLSILVS